MRLPYNLGKHPHLGGRRKHTMEEWNPTKQLNLKHPNHAARTLASPNPDDNVRVSDVGL